MARSVEPLVVGRVIGDVLDIFTPAAELTVHYSTKQVHNGCDIKPSSAADKPHVRILSPVVSSSLYTLVMVDPDAPTPSEPRLREWLHWIVVDIPEGHDATKGREMVPYMGPQPPTGIHRYILVLFKQERATEGGCQLPDARANFSTRQFAAQNSLGLPVAAVYFNSQKEPAVKKR
ncbi:Phosphatidylethanolamine-binding protein - like 6 [Theobroma cacao]|uniref:Protein MOTHER of FT and TFL1 isoform X1 n=1 Tax=Theobroma cacao TaxID=3641 RepID=A0AB32WML1_THECC|nr:PREDICTED: protein MOTHER of FT and TFL1 isoform X1 [Theobroma cacao]WRX27083.1 Phosphatidylethanolamine-binding protein - like 6 [Theobroma cacao]